MLRELFLSMSNQLSNHHGKITRYFGFRNYNETVVVFIVLSVSLMTSARDSKNYFNFATRLKDVIFTQKLKIVFKKVKACEFYQSVVKHLT